MKVIFYSISDDRKKINKTLSNKIGETNSLKLKENTSIISPVLEVKSDSIGDVDSVNYAYIPDFGRYYFVDNIELRLGSIIMMTLSVDVLTSYAAQLMRSQFFIARSESLNSRWYIDGEMPITSRRVVSYMPIGAIPQSAGGRKYTITVAGGI